MLKMKGAVYLTVKLLLGPETKVSLREVKGVCAIFVNQMHTTEFTGASWEEALWKVRDYAFTRCEQQGIRLSTAHAGEMLDAHTHPVTETVSPKQNGDGVAPTKSAPFESK